jgi:hypothetical protein
VRNEGILQTVEEDKYKPQEEGRKANWIGHILHRNCFLQHVLERKIEGRIELTGR